MAAPPPNRSKLVVRVAFRYGDTRIFARLVCWWRGGDSAHCEIATPYSPYIGYYHDCVSSSFLDGGVRKKVIALRPEKWRVYEIPTTQWSEVEKWLEANKGAGYDWAGLFGFIIPRINGWAKRKFCSEALAEILGFTKPNKFDLVLLESVVQRLGHRLY